MNKERSEDREGVVRAIEQDIHMHPGVVRMGQLAGTGGGKVRRPKGKGVQTAYPQTVFSDDGVLYPLGSGLVENRGDAEALPTDSVIQLAEETRSPIEWCKHDR